MEKTIVGPVDADLLETVKTDDRLSAQTLTLLTAIEEYVIKITETTEDVYNYQLHYHNYHRHRTKSNHPQNFGPVTEGHGGTTYLYEAKGHRTLVELLIWEMKVAKDKDFNGMRYFHDFCFSYDDDNLPRCIRGGMQSYCMPGKPKHFIVDKKGQWTPRPSPVPLYWPNEYNIIHIGWYYDKHDVPYPRFINRPKTCTVLSWEEYIDSLGDRYSAQVKPRLK